MGSLANQKVLPTINFTRENLEVGSPSWVSTSKEVVRALEEFGCFMATYSGFAPHLTEAIFGASKEAFDLPTHVKERRVSDIDSRSYAGRRRSSPLLEGLNIENATTEEGVDKFTNQLWPSGNEKFRETVFEYSKAVAELEGVVMRMLSEVYGITKSYESLHKAQSYLLRLLKYHVPGKEESDIGLTRHTDKNFTTILQQYHVEGLHMQTKNGDWIVTDPSPSAFLVLASEACMGWTNGRIHTPYHRTIIEGSEERFSIGLFSFIDVEIQVPENLVDDDHPLQYKPFETLKFIEFVLSDEGKALKDVPLRAYCGV